MTDDAENGDRRRDGLSRERINEIGRNYYRFTRLVLILFYIQVASLFAFGILSVYLTNENHKRSDENAKLIVTIQEERKNSIISSCQDQNDRHDNTIQLLQKNGDDQIRKQPERSAEIRNSIRLTILLIDALVPKRDCLKIANEAVKTP